MDKENYKENYKLFSVKKTVLQLLKDRNYDISDEEKIFSMDLETFNEYREKLSEEKALNNRRCLSNIYSKNLSSDKILVFFTDNVNKKKQIPLETIKIFMKEIAENNTQEAILIINTNLSSKSLEALRELTLVYWQFFYDSDLTYNPVLHRDVPKHELLTESEKNDKIKELRTSVSKLPIIKFTDPIVRYYGWKRGDLIRITREDTALSCLVPISINYRIVI